MDTPEYNYIEKLEIMTYLQFANFAVIHWARSDPLAGCFWSPGHKFDTPDLKPIIHDKPGSLKS